jgi:DNA polymerase-1
MAKKLVILDSNSILHRVFHALPPLRTKKGELVNAVYGFFSVLFRIVKELQPDYLCACFDFPSKTFRHEKLKEYKAQRPPLPKDLAQQIPKVKEILEAFKIPIFEKEGFEADDLIGTIVSREPEVEKIIISGDLDNLQLISKNVKVYFLKKVKESFLYTLEEVEKKYRGIKPNQIIDLKALVGDPSDNISGVPGVGPKTAVQLLKQFKSVENLYQEIQNSKEKIPEKIRENLVKYQEKVFLNKNLLKIKTDLALEFDLEKCRFGKYQKEKIIEIFKKYEFQSLIDRFLSLESEREKTQKATQIGENLRLW